MVHNTDKERMFVKIVKKYVPLQVEILKCSNKVNYGK